jgi:hypothetical protein
MDYQATALEIIRLQRGMIEDALRRKDPLDKDFWIRFYILTGQFMECARSAKTPDSSLPPDHRDP